MIVQFLLERFNYAAVIVLMMIGLYIIFATGNLVKKMVGLSVFQTSVGLFYISMSKVAGGRPPILEDSGGIAVDEGAASVAEIGAAGAEAQAEALIDAAPPEALAPPAYVPPSLPDSDLYPPLDVVYSNPLPHVLILTAIVVGVATLAVGLALVVRIREAYGTIEEDDLHAEELAAERPA